MAGFGIRVLNLWILPESWLHFEKGWGSYILGKYFYFMFGKY